jgi:hypothetical protein
MIVMQWRSIQIKGWLVFFEFSGLAAPHYVQSYYIYLSIPK